MFNLILFIKRIWLLVLLKRGANRGREPYHASQGERERDADSAIPVAMVAVQFRAGMHACLPVLHCQVKHMCIIHTHTYIHTHLTAETHARFTANKCWGSKILFAISPQYVHSCTMAIHCVVQWPSMLIELNSNDPVRDRIVCCVAQIGRLRRVSNRIWNKHIVVHLIMSTTVVLT